VLTFFQVLPSQWARMGLSGWPSGVIPTAQASRGEFVATPVRMPSIDK
jgi:hypothetical protein